MTRLRALAPLVVAAVLAAVALLTVQRASCDDPGQYVLTEGGYQLVGGCLAAGDIVVKPPLAPPASASDENAKS